MSHNPVIDPTAQDAELAAHHSQILAAYLKRGKTARLCLDDSDQELQLSGSTLRLFQTLLEYIGRGHGVQLVSTEAELTTQQAADLLNVSRPYLVKVLEQGKLPFRYVGTRRRVRLCDALDYKRHQDYSRHQALDALVQQAEELDMGY